MSILVLGGAGYIGSHTVYELIDAGEDVVIADNLETGHIEAVHPKAKFYKGDIRDRAFVDSVFENEKIDAVIHFAANSLVGESMVDPLKYYDNNVNGTKVLYEEDNGMKLGEAIPNYQAYRNELQDKKTSIYKQYKKTKEKAERTNDEEWIQKAAELELSYKEATDDFDKYENVLNSLREQWCAAANTENDKALADPETGLGATIGKIMTTIARMCAGDKVPYTDEKKVMEYDDKMYARAKQAQMIMASMKKKQKEYDSLWDKEGGEYDPEGVADNTEAQGELPDIPSSDGDSTDTGEAVSDSE